jgi:hypothetical protein
MLHHQKVDALVAADVVEGADVGMIQRRDGPRLALEPITRSPVVGHTCRQHFDRDGTIEPRVAREIHLAHATGSNASGDFVWPNAPAFER